ncbi:MAG: tyrosine-type recombinase/integrase [Bacteroidales bacterium]
MEKFKRAKLNDRGNDLEKQWYVEYMYQHPEKMVMVPFRKYISLKLKTATARRMKADQLIKELNEWLMMGGNPFAAESLGKTRATAAIERILALKKASNRRRTYLTYKDAAGKFEKFLTLRRISSLAVEDISSMIAQQFSDYLIEDLSLAHRTHNNMVNALKAMWTMMNKRFNLHINPWQAVDQLEEEEPSLVMFSPEEMELIKTNLREEDFTVWLCAGLVFYCALRPAEIIRLKVYNIQLDEGAIYLDGRITKNKKSRWVSIPSPELIEDFRSLHLERLDPEWYVFSTGLVPGDWENYPTRIADRWREWAKRHNIKKGIYDLKHNAAGKASDAGIPLRELQLHFRHHSLEQTEQYIKRFRREVGPGFNEKYPRM